jgi:uncharacterized membrane protein
MPCFAGLLAIAFPRVILILVWLFSNYLDRAYHNMLWPLLGFIFLPLTTLAYAWALNTGGGSIQGLYLVAVVVAVLLDLGLLGGGGWSRRRWRD